MNEQKKQIIDVLSNALDMANKAGVFGLQDSFAVFQALQFVAKEILEPIGESDHGPEMEKYPAPKDIKKLAVKKA